MSKFDLRDISDKLTSSRDAESVVDALLGYLVAVQSDWYPTLAFYEVSRDAFVRVYGRTNGRLERRDVVLPVDQLPPRLVRKFFHPSAFFNAEDRKTLLAKLFQNSPSYEPDPVEAPQIQPLTTGFSWQSCTCLPLADQDDLLAMLVIVSPRKGAFTSRSIGEILPLKSLATLALARRLHESRRAPTAVVAGSNTDRQAFAAQTQELQQHVAQLHAHAQALAADNRTKQQRLEDLSQQLNSLNGSADDHRRELERVKGTLSALEEQSGQAAALLEDAHSQLALAQSRLSGTRRTMQFLKEVFQVLAQDHDETEISRTMVAWFCEHFEVDRCSLMRLDPSDASMRIFAQRGLDATMAQGVRVRVGQGISGWVAHNRKPLFVRMRQEVSPVRATGQDSYNSDSFISVPLVHKNQLYGVMNLSNKRDGDSFDESDLERAVLAGAVLAITLAGEARSERIELIG